MFAIAHSQDVKDRELNNLQNSQSVGARYTSPLLYVAFLRKSYTHEIALYSLIAASSDWAFYEETKFFDWY